MQKMLLGLLTTCALLLSPAAFSSTDVWVGYGSDYIWRGASQNSGKGAGSLGVVWSAEQNGAYLGGWASQVDYGDDGASIEKDLFGGYVLPITDKINVDLGYIRYAYDEAIDSFEELYAKVSVGNLSTAYYRDIDTHANYIQVGYKLAFLPEQLGSFELIHGGTDNLDADTFTQLNWSKDFNKHVTLLGIIGEDVFEGTASDSINLELIYNF
jgi:uncharacterized protein (TIGR02001 family)